MDWGQIAFWGGSIVLLAFAVVTVVWAPGRRHDPGRGPERGSRHDTPRDPADDPRHGADPHEAERHEAKRHEPVR